MRRQLRREHLACYLFPMSVTELPITVDRNRIAAFCRERGIRKLSVFGSVLREDFDPARSDVDVLADFAPGALDGVGLRYFGYGDELSQILGRQVDFCAQLNRHIKPQGGREAIPLSEQACSGGAAEAARRRGGKAPAGRRAEGG